MASLLPTATATATAVTDWSDTVRYCEYHSPDVIYVAIGCSQKRYPYGKHSPQECPPFVRQWETRTGEKARSVCILIDPDLEDDLYVLRDLSDEELSRTRIITVRQNFSWLHEANTFIYALCDLAVRAPNTYLIVQDYSGEEIRRYYPLGDPRWGPTLLQKVTFDVSFMDGGCWLDFDKVRLERDAVTGGFLQPPYMKLHRMAAVTTPEVLLFHVEKRYYTLLSYVWGYYRHPGSRDWATADIVIAKLGALPHVYRAATTTAAGNLKLLALHMLDDFAQTAGTELNLEEIMTMLEEPTEKVLPSALSTLKLLITSQYQPESADPSSP